eukprot:COSAG01_NODE_52104_length_349_cov_0.776000_1_plen_52_part_10
MAVILSQIVQLRACVAACVSRHGALAVPGSRSPRRAARLHLLPLLLPLLLLL